MIEANEGEIKIKITTTKLLLGMIPIFIIGYFVFIGDNPFTGNSIKTNEAVDGITEVKTILQGFRYNPDTITVKEGSKVRLVIDNRDSVDHGLHMPQFGISRGLIPNAINTIEFTAVDSPTNGQAMPTCTLYRA